MAPKATTKGNEWEKTLHEKLVEIAQEVPYIQKKGTNEALDYKYVGDAQVVTELRDQFLNRGIIVTPRHEVINVSVIDRGNRAANIVTTIESTFTFSDGRESLTVTTVGQGTDSGDKGAFKAMTGARKYAILQALMIATGDDPEQTRDDEMETAGGSKPASAAQKGKLHTMGKAVGMDDEALRKFVYKETGKNSSNALTNEDMQKLFELLAALEASGGTLVD